MIESSRFESRQERRENFLRQGQLSVLTLSVSVPFPCYRIPVILSNIHVAGYISTNIHPTYVASNSNT